MQAWFTKGKNLHKLKHENEQQTKVIKEKRARERGSRAPLIP